MSNSISRRRVLGMVAVMPLFAWSARARAALPKPAALTPQDQADVQRVQAYLNGITTMQSRFQQYAADGSIASGTIYLQRPGKMRIDYDDPVPVLIVADGRDVYYWDKKLKQLSQARVENTPAWFLLRPQIRLSGDVTVVKFERGAGVFRIGVTETEHPDQGFLTVVVSEHPLALRQWTIVDAQQKPVTVTLEEPRFGIKLSENLFYFAQEGPDFRR